MEFSAQMIASLIGGTVVGDPEVKVNNFAKIEEGKSGCISFLTNMKYENYIYETQSSIVLVNNDFQPQQDIKATLIKVPNAYEALAKLMAVYESMKPKRTGIDPLAFVAPTAKVGKDVYLAPFSVVEDGAVIGDGTQLHPHATVGANAQVGESCILYSHAVVYHGCKVGNRCILHAGCVIGADGFGFAPTPEGYEKIPQIGIVTIEDDVEIGANTCVDRSTMGSTFVRRGVKLDNLVQIAHNDDIGAHTVMSAQVGVAGSTKIGEWCMFGGQVGIGGHANIANRTMAGAQSGIPNNIKKEGTTIQGSPAIDGRNFWKSSAIFKNLPDMWADMNQMKKEIKALKELLNEKQQ